MSFHARLEGESRMRPPDAGCADCARREFKTPEEVLEIMKGEVGSLLICAECSLVRSWQFDITGPDFSELIFGELCVNMAECGDYLLVSVKCFECNTLNGLVMALKNGRASCACSCTPRRTLETGAAGDLGIMNNRRRLVRSISVNEYYTKKRD